MQATFTFWYDDGTTCGRYFMGVNGEHNARGCGQVKPGVVVQIFTNQEEIDENRQWALEALAKSKANLDKIESDLRDDYSRYAFHYKAQREYEAIHGRSAETERWEGAVQPMETEQEHIQADKRWQEHKQYVKHQEYILRRVDRSEAFFKSGIQVHPKKVRTSRQSSTKAKGSGWRRSRFY